MPAHRLVASRILSLELPPFDPLNSRAAALDAEGHDVISLGRALPFFPPPYFTNHHMTVCALGAVPVEAPVADRATFDLRWTDIAPHVTARTRAVVLCNPSNPTGSPVAAAGGSVIVRELAARGIAVISDETYRAFVFEGSHWSGASEPAWRDNVVVAPPSPWTAPSSTCRVSRCDRFRIGIHLRS